MSIFGGSWGTNEKYRIADNTDARLAAEGEKAKYQFARIVIVHWRDLFARLERCTPMAKEDPTYGFGTVRVMARDCLDYRSSSIIIPPEVQHILTALECDFADALAGILEDAGLSVEDPAYGIASLAWSGHLGPIFGWFDKTIEWLATFTG